MSRRIALITDANMHLGPDLARELARRDHDLVLGDPSTGLVPELEGIGSDVERPSEVDHFCAALLDGHSSFQTGQFFALSGGWDAS